jgi:hypothetical protein
MSDHIDEIQQQWLEARLAWEGADEAHQKARDHLEQVTIAYHVAINNWLKRRKDEPMQ